MAPSEETATATCSQQQKQDVAGAKLQQDSPKIQQDAPAKREEDVNRSTSPSCIDQVIDGLKNASDRGDSMKHSASPSSVDSVTDGHKSVTTDRAENADSLVESQNSTNARVKDCEPHVNCEESGFNSRVGNTNSVVDRHKNVDTTCKEDIDHILDSSQNVANTDQVVDDPDNFVTTAGHVCQAGDSPKTVVVADKINDQILDGPKDVAADCVENTDQVVTSAKSVTATCLNSVINERVVNPSVDGGDKVVNTPESIACASVENTAEVTDRPESKAGGTNAISRVANMACVVSVTQQQVTNISTDDASHVSVASKVVDVETANEGCGDRPGAADEDQSCDGDDSVREQCLFLLKELVSQADEVAQQRWDGAQHMEGGPLWCRLPVTKVSEALKFCRSSTNSALADNKQSSTKQYTACDSHHSSADEPDLVQNRVNENRMKEMGASSSILLLYPSPPDSFAEESTPPPMFQGHRTMTVDPSLPSTPDDSSEDSPLGEDAVLFTPTCMKVPGSPSVASVTPPSNTVLGPLCMTPCPKTPCSSSSSMKADKHDPASSLLMVEQKPQPPSTIKLPAPQRFLFQLEPVHLIKMSDGQKLFACDICSGVYQRSFSLKRHFLRTHINHRYLTERDISNCCIIVSERFAKENPSGSSVEKKIVAVGTDVDATQGCPDNVTKNSSSDKCSTVNSKVENDVIFPNLYCCHSCSLCFDTKDELRYHLSTYKHAAATSKEKTATKPISGSQKARSKSLPNLKKGSKVRDRSMSASSQELSSLVQVPTAHCQSMCESAILSPGHISEQITFSQMSSFVIPDQSVVTSTLPKSTASLSSRSLGSGHSSKHLPSSHTSKCDCSSEASTPDCSLKHMPSNYSSNSYMSNHLLKPVSSGHLSKPSSPDHSSKSSSSGHSSMFSLSCHSTNPPSSGHSLPGHSSNLARPEFISSAVTNLTLPEQLPGPVISKQPPANIGHFTKPISNEKLLKSSERGQVLCLYCDKSFSTPTLHKRHVSRSHPHAQLSLQNKTPPHKCAYCIKPGGTFRELPLLVQHLLANHPDLCHVCTTCELRFDSKQALDHHQTLVHHGDCRWNSVCMTIPSRPLSQALTSDVNTVVKSSQSAPELQDGSKEQTCSEGSADLLGSGGEFLYTCSVCRQVFNDYVAMCRHHRQVHKGKRSLNSIVQGAGSPASMLENRSQSPFVITEKGSKNQVQDKKDPESNVDEQRMTSDVMSMKPVNSNVCRSSESESEINAIKLSCKRQGLETRDFVSETVKEIHQTTDLNKTEPKDEISNVANGKSEENVDFITFPSVDAGEGMASSSGVPHCPAQFPVFGSNTHQVDVFSSCAVKCVSHCLDVSNIVSCTTDKIGPHTNSSEFTFQITEYNDEVSACEGSDFSQKSGSNSQVFGTLDAKTTSDHVLNKQKYNCILKSPFKSVFEDISDQSEDSVDLHKLDTSVCVEPGSKISLVGTADHVKTMSVNKCVDFNLGVNPSLESGHSAAAAKIPDCDVDSSETPTAGTLWPFETCSESSLADTSTSHRASPASTLIISDPTEARPNCLIPVISDPLEVSSDALQLQTRVSVDEKSEMCTDVISDSEDKLSLIKNKSSATENSEMMSVVPEASDCVTESCQYSMEESFHSLVAETMDSTTNIPEFSLAETSGHVVENSKSSPGEMSETSSDCREISCNPPSDETPTFLEECSDAVLKKVSDSVEDNIKFSLGEISDHAEPVICNPKDSVKPSLGVILYSVESVGESSVTETLETLEQTASLPLTERSDFTEEISNLLLEDDLGTVKGSDKQSSSSTEECDKTMLLPDSLHSIEWPSKLSLVDTSDSMQEESSAVSLAETAGSIRSGNASLTEISDSMESCCKEKFSETRNTDESTVLSLDDVADDMESSSKPSLGETLNSTEESTGLVEVISSKPHLAAESFKFSVTESIESLEGNEKPELTETSYFSEENFQSPLMENSEEIVEPLLIETSVEQNYCPAVTESSVSVEEDSKLASAETTDLMEEISKSSLEIVDFMEENSKSVKEISDSLEENSESTLPESSDSIEGPESFDSVGEGSKSISMESFDSVKENHQSEFTGSSGFLEESLKSVLTDNLDTVKEDLSLVSAEVSDSSEEDYKAALTEGCESMRENPENSEHLAESPQALLSSSMYSIETDSKLLSHTTDTDSDAIPETSAGVPAKSKPAASVTQGEGVSSRTLRNNSAPLTKSFDPLEENDTIPLSQRLLQNKNEAAINDQAAGSGRVLRKSSAHSAAKPVEVLVGSNVRRSAVSKNDESSVDQEVTDVESGVPKSRPKASMAAVRRTRLRKFSRRVKGDQVQEEQHLDPETLFYCRIAGNIQENLLHHLDGKLEHEVMAKSRDLNNTSLSHLHTSVTTGHEEKQNHRHHHRTPWEKFNFPKKYDGRCREGTVCLASYIKDMSHLDISTQLTMQQNLQRLSAAPTISRSSVDVSAEISKDDVIGFCRGLCLGAKVCADRRRSLRSAANRGRDALPAAPGGAASTFTASASLKRWSSADDVAAAESVVELSGEWVRPRSYFCAACGVMFIDLWDLEDHKHSQHPNVWCTHYEFEQADLDQAVDTSKSQCGGLSSKDFCRRFLLVRESVETVPLPTLSSEVKCTKCERGFSTLPELHRHILECGGDTTWMLLPSPNSSGRRTRKWRPFGSRRRRQQGSHRRGMKRNIPTTPVKQYFRARHRSVAGDSIQRMLANLPAKRSTRRVIQFSEDEIKTRSQGTMHSNRLLRKRYKVSFASGVVRTSHKTGHRMVQSLHVRAPTADTNDTVYRKLAIRTPKKLPGTPSVAPTVSSEQTSAPKQELPSKKLPQSKSQPVSSVPRSKSTGSDIQKKGPRVSRSLSPVASKSVSVPLNGSEEPKLPSLHKSRSRSKKPVSPQTCNGLNDATEENSTENSGSGINVQAFDMDISTVGSTETSNILAAMRIAMLEGAITKIPPSGPSIKKLTKKVSVKKHPCTEENKTVVPGKRKKLVSCQQNSVKKKTKLSQSELEERFLRNKGYTHPDEVTDEPIICKGCGLQFDSGSAELRHRKTCIYVPSQEDAGLNEVEHLHSCLLSCVQSPSGSNVLKHSEQCKAALSSNTEVTGELSACCKKTTAVKAKSKNRDNSSSITTISKQENIAGLKKSPGSNSENPTKIGRTKVKPRGTNIKKQITKRRNINDSRIIKGDVGNNMDALKKGLTSAENISTSTMKQKADSLEIVSAIPVETQRKPGTESTSRCPARKKKKVDISENSSSSPVARKKKIDNKENASNSSLGTKKKIDSTENTKNSPGRTKKKIKDMQIIRDETVRTKTKSESHNRIGVAKRKVDGTENVIVVTTERKLDGTEGAISSSAGVVKSVISDFAGVKKKSRNSENFGSGQTVSSKKRVNIGRTVSGSLLGGRKKLGSTRKRSPVRTKGKFECTKNVNVGPFEIKPQPPITHSDSTNLGMGKEECDQSENERTKKQMECDGIVLVAETVDNNAAKMKKRSVTANIVLTARKKEFGSADTIKGGKRKSGSTDSMHNSTDKRKHECCSTENESHSPASSDMDDKMPELQKEEPIENLKTETPSPKVEDLCDIPILSPVGCDPLSEDCEEKRNGDTLTKDIANIVSVVEEKEGQSLPVEGKKLSKGTVKNCAGLRQAGATIKTRKSSAVFKKKDVRLDTLQIPVHIEPSKQEASVHTQVAVVEAGVVIPQGEMDSDDKPLAECFGARRTVSKQSKETLTCRAATSTGKDETQKVVQEHDIEKSASLSKQQRHKPVRHRNSTPLWDRKDKKVATKPTAQLTEEDSNDDLLPIAKLKEVIQKKILPLKILDSNTPAARDPGPLVVHMNSEVTQGLESLAERNVPAVITPDEVLRSESSVQHSTEEPPEISDHVSLAEKIPVMSRRAALNRGKRGRTRSWHQDTRSVNGQHQSQSYRKASLPVGVLEISAFDGVPTGTRSKVEKFVIPKTKAGKYTEQAESQNAQMENLKFLTGHEKEENSLCFKVQDVEGKRQLVTKRKTKRKFGKMQSGNGEGVNSPVSKMQNTAVDLDNKTDCLASTRHETNISGVGKKKEDPLFLFEETGSGIDKNLLVTKRKRKRPLNDFRSEVAVVASPVDLMSYAAPSVGKSKKVNHFVSEGHQTKMSDTDDESKEIQSQRTSCLTGKKCGITKRKMKTQLEEIRSHCNDNGHQTHSSKQRRETDHLGGERVAENEGTNSVVGKRLVVTKRKLKQQMKESESYDGGLACSGISQRQDTNTVIGKDEQSDHTDVHVFVCEEEEIQRQVREPTEETVLSCREVTSVSICEEVKVRRRKQPNSTDVNRKAVHLIDNKEIGLDHKKKANFMTHKTKKTRQNIKLVIGKRRKVSPTEGEEQMCRLIVDGEEKQTIITEKDEASIVCVQERELGDEMETDKDNGKDKLSDMVVEAENTSTSVPDTDSRIDLICESENMNVLRRDTEKATNTLRDETDDTTNDLSTEGEDTSTFICLRKETSDLIGGKEHTENLTGEEESSSRIDENDTSGPAFDNNEGLICQVERLDSVENAETNNMDNEKDYRATVTEDQEEINGTVLGSDMVIGKKETVPVKSGHADSLVCQENCLNPVIIQQGEMNGQVVQMGSSLLAINIVGSTKVEESQADMEGPLRQARRTRCNTSYEELYTWSDVTSETEEESSQDLPDANIMAALCQNTDVSTYEEIAAMIANGDFFPSGSKKKKKKKLRNNSRQYRNGHLRRKRHKKQKLRTKLIKKPKRSSVNEFIVTDIETGQEESQDSCESLLLAPVLKMGNQPVDTETHTKSTDRKKKKKRMKASVQPESVEQTTSNENVQVSKPKQKRKSSVGSVFFCTLCNKHYSTNYNLMKHKLSLMHKRMSEKDQSTIPADVQNTEHEHLPPCPFENTESENTSSVEQVLETELRNSRNPNVETESSCSVNHSLETEQESGCLVVSAEMEQLCSSVQNTEFENSCSSAVQSARAEHPCSSDVLHLDADHQSVAENVDSGKSCMVLTENTVYEEQCSVVQHVEGEELCATEPERTYTLMQNMEVEQFSTCIQSTSLPEREADQSSTYVSEPAASHSGSGHISEPGSPVQNSTLDGVQQGTNPVQTLPAVGAVNGTATTVSNNDGSVFIKQPGVCIEHQKNVTSDWLGKERDIQQNMNAINWPTSGETQKQAGWFEGQVDNQWLYTGQWSQEMAWGKEVNSSMNWNADTNQNDGTFFQSNSASLGSILDSVNQILDNERSAHGLPATAGYQPYVDLLQSGTADVDPAGGLRELQQAMGATDEEMAMLQQLGEGSWPLEDADIMDLDNQKSNNVTPTVASVSTSSTPTNTAASRVVKLVEGTRERTRGEEDGNAVSSIAMAQAAVTARAFSGRGGLRTQDIQLARYETKDMVCPVCSRRFLGLSALRAHLAAAHNSSTRHRTQAIKRPRIVPSSASDGSEEPTRHVCLVCKELLPDEQGLADHVAVAHVERQNSGGRRPDGMGGSNHSTGGGGGDEGLRSHMTSALGGLLTRALNNFLGKNRSQPSPPATQVPSPSAGSPGDSHRSPLLTQPIARLLGRGLKVTNRRHSSGPADELLFGCVDCDERFSSESNRNRHIARAHRGHHHRRLSTDSPLELTRLASPLTSSESTVSEVDTDSMPLSIRLSNFNSQPRPGDSDPCRSQLITANTVDSETSMVTKENCSSVKDVSNLKGESCSAARVQGTDHTVGTPGNSGEEEQERATVAITRSPDLSRVQDQGRLTQWRNSMKSEASQLRPESVCNVNDEDSIKAKAVAALRALNARDKRIRNGLPGTIGAALWSGASRKKSKGLNCDNRFRFPLVRKTPPSTNRFASLAEKKKKYISSTVKFEAISQPKDCPEEERQEVPAMPLNAAIPFSYDIYEFQDEVEQIQRPSDLRLRTPVGKVGSQDSGADTGPSSDLEESRMAEWDSLQIDPQPLIEQKGEGCTSVERHTLKNPKRKLLKSLKLSEQNSSHKTRLKHSHSSRKRESGKKKRWHRIIVDSGDDTSDTETVAEPHDTYRVALDQRLSNHTEGEKYVNSEIQTGKSMGIKRRHVVPCLSGVLVEDRQCRKRAKTAKHPCKGSSRPSTKTDLLMSVFAKSRQRNSYINAPAAGHSVSAQPPFCSTSFSGSYRSVGTFGNTAEAESESDSGSLATSVSTGNLAMSSDDERMVRGRKPRKQKREKQKMAAL